MENELKGEDMKPQNLITEEHVKKALLKDKGNDVHLVSWKVANYTKKGDNFACVVSSVEVEYSLKEHNRKVIYVVKVNPCTGLKDYKDLYGLMFLREIGFYVHLLPELNSVLAEVGLELLHFPLCFHGSLDPMKEQLYLSDMRPLGFRMCDKRRGLDVAHTSLVMKELGRLHASSLLLEDKMKVAVEVKHEYLIRDPFESENSDLILSVVENAITTAVGILQKVGGYKKAISWAESLIPKLKYLLTDGLRSDGFNVVNHGDCWNNNILFKYNEEGQPVELILLDLQICRKVSLAIDLNYVMFTSLNGDIRNSNLTSFLSTYYTSFRSVMEAGGLDMHFTEEDLLKEYRNKNTLGGYFGIMAIPLILHEPSEVSGEAEEPEGGFAKVFSEFRAKALKTLDKDPLLRPRFLSMFDEFMEIGLIP